MSDYDAIAAARATADESRISADVTNLPPGYFTGFDVTLNTDYHVTVGGGSTSVEGQQVTVNSSHEIVDSDFTGTRLGQYFYYIYLTTLGDYKVDRSAPEFSDQYLYYAHPLFRWRAIGKIWVDDDNDIKYATNDVVGTSAQVIVAAYDTDETPEADYRCTGTSDQILINAAIDFLTGAYGGGIVFLSRGTFLTAGEILPNDGVIIEGSGWATVIEKNHSGPGITCEGFGATIDNAGLRNFTIQASSSDTSGDPLIYVNNTNYFSLKSIHAARSYRHGIFVNSSDNIDIDDLLITNFGNEASAVFAYGLTVGNGGSGSVNGVKINNFSDSKPRPLRGFRIGTKHVVSNIEVINLSSAEEIIGVDISTGECNLSNIVVRDFSVTSASDVIGVLIYICSGNRITGLTVRDIENTHTAANCKGLRIFGAAGGDDNIITGASITNCSGTGVEITADSDSNYLTGTVADNGTNISDSGTNTTFINTSGSYFQGGNVGVGLNDPAELLEVESSASTTAIQISNSATDGDPYLAFALSGTKVFTIGVDDGDSDKLKIGTTAIGTNTRLTIDSSGDINIPGTLTAVLGDDIVTAASMHPDALRWPEDAEAYWPFDEGAGTTVTDVKGGLEGTLSGGVAFVDGPAGGALDFSAANAAKADIGADGLGDSFSAFTIFAMLKGGTIASEISYAAHRGITGSIGDSLYCIGVNDTGKVIGAFNGKYIDGNTNIDEPSDWYSVAMVWDGSVVYVYVNGVLGVQYNNVSITNNIATERLVLGQSEQTNVTRGWPGQLADFRTYSRALTEAEIKSLNMFVRPGRGMVVADQLYVPPLYIDQDNDRVGIGTSSPGSLLHLYSTTALMPELRLQTYNSGASSAPFISFYGLADDTGAYEGARIQAMKRGGVNDAQFDLAFHTRAEGGALTEYVRILGANGNVGIGTSSPDTKLQVVGISRFGEDTTNYSEFESDGTLEFNGNATVWNDANVGGAILQLATAGNPGKDEFKDDDGDDTGITTYAFAVGEYVCGSIEIPHDYKEGTNMVFHIHWQGIDAPTGVDNVKWQVTYTIGKELYPLDDVTIDSAETEIDTQYAFYRTDVETISGTGVNIGDQLLFQIQRIASVGDAYAGEALVATVGIHYECDTVGSRSITSK